VTRRDNRSALRVVSRERDGEPSKTFCGHCGREPDGDPDRLESRVCPTCGFGLLLSAPANAAPGPRDPFIVVDQALTVCAVSRAAERLLGITETDAVNRHVSTLLTPSDAEGGDNPLLAALALTALSDGPVQTLVVRPANTYGVRYWARIGRCGPRKAALLVLADAT
jgi:PAS domain-containing protein